MAFVAYILASTQYVPNIVDRDHPQASELVLLTAVTKGASPGDSVIWGSEGANSGSVLFYTTDYATQSPIIATPDSFTTTVGSDGTSGVYVGGPEIAIPTITATWGAPQSGKTSSKAIKATQRVAFWTVGQGGDEKTPEISGIGAGGPVNIPTDTGGSPYPPDQYGSVSTRPSITQAGRYVAVVAQGDPTDDISYTQLGPIRDFNQTVDFYVPYFDLATGIGKQNNIAYFIWTTAWGKGISNINTFPASGTAFIRPDDQNYPPSNDLNPPLYLEADSQDADTYPMGTISTEYDPLSSFDRDGNLNFAIPAYDGMDDDDRIAVTLYLNGWYENSNKLNTIQITVTKDGRTDLKGSGFVTGFGPAQYKDQRFLRVKFKSQDIHNICPYQGTNKLGYGWVQYTATTQSGIYYSPSLYSHVNFCTK